MSISFQDFQKSCLSISNYLDFKLFTEIVKERYSNLNLPNIYHYVVLDPKFYNDEIFNGVYTTLIRLSHDVASLLISFLALLYYVLIIVVKSLFLIFPHAVSLSKAIIKFHREKLSPTDIAVEVVFFALVLLYLYFRKRLQKAWKQFQLNLSRKSEKAAKILPHLLFFLSAGVIAYFGSKFLLPLTSKRVLPVFTVAIPLLKTLQTLRKVSNNNHPVACEKECIETVILWIVLSIYFALGAACETIPFSSVILSYSLYIREFTLVTAVWVQASPACANIVFETVHPLIQYYTDKIPAANLGSSASLDSVFMGLKFFGLSDRIIKGLKGLMEDSVAVMVCVLFLFMPARLANIGVIIIALLLPAYKSSNCVFIAREAHAATKHKALLTNQNNSTATSVGNKKKTAVFISSMTPKMWLEYWTCLGILMLLRFYNIRLWASSMMVLCLWLQNANFHGSAVVIMRVINFANVLLCYKRKEGTVPEDDDGGDASVSGTTVTTPFRSKKSSSKSPSRATSATGVSAARRGRTHRPEEEEEEEEERNSDEYEEEEEDMDASDEMKHNNDVSHTKKKK